MDAFISFIALWPGTWAPRLWNFCWGQRISISNNSALFSLLGTNFGGNGLDYFQLPDFRGRVPVGQGTGPGLSPNKIGQFGGYEMVRLITSELPAHKHVASLSTLDIKLLASNAAGTESTPGANNAKTFGATKDGFNVGDALYNTEVPSIDMNGIAINGGSVVVENTGDSRFHENRQPYLVTNYIICMEGIFPPRS